MSTWIHVEPDEMAEMFFLDCKGCGDKYIFGAFHVESKTLLEIIKSFEELHNDCTQKEGAK